MAVPSGGLPAPLKPAATAENEAHRALQAPLGSLEGLLYQDGGVCAFDFFQAVRMLMISGLKDRVMVGKDGPPHREIARFLAQLSLAFPPSAIHQLTRGTGEQPPRMTVTFMGLTGPSGVLPRHYTERLWVESKGPERAALQDWLDLFNHRFISLFYRAWEKYRFYLPFERGEAAQRDPDPFSRALFSLIGLGFRSHRNCFRVAYLEQKGAALREQVLGRLDDLALLRFSGFFAHRPRCAWSLGVFLETYLKIPVKVLQFQGQWLYLEGGSQTAMAAAGANNQLGQDALVGNRVWDVQSKVRIRLGPMNYAQFQEFLPDPTPQPRSKRLFLLAQLVRFYLGAELDVDFQLVLNKEEVPGTKMGPASRLGWNTWSRRQPYPRNADDSIFTVSESPWLNRPES